MVRFCERKIFVAALLFCITHVHANVCSGADSLREAMEFLAKTRGRIRALERSEDPARYDRIAELRGMMGVYRNQKFEIDGEASILRYDSQNRTMSLKLAGLSEDAIRFETNIHPREALDFKRFFSNMLNLTVEIDEHFSPRVTRVTDKTGRIRFRAVTALGDGKSHISVLTRVPAEMGMFTFLSGDGKENLILKKNGEVTSHSTITGETFWKASVHTTPTGGSISQDGKIFVLSTISGSLYFLSMKDGNPLGRLKFPASIRRVSISYDSRLVAVGLMSGDVYIVDINSQETLFHTKHTGPVTSVNFSSDNRFAFSGGGDSRVKIIYLPVMKIIWELHLKGVPETLSISPTGDNLSALISFFYLSVWKMNLWTKDIAWRFNSFVTSFDISRDGSLIVCSFLEKKIGFYEVKSGKTQAVLPLAYPVRFVKFLPYSNLVACADTAGNLIMVDYSEKKAVALQKLGSPAAGMIANDSGEYLSVLCENGYVENFYLKSVDGTYPLFAVGPDLVLISVVDR